MGCDLRPHPIMKVVQKETISLHYYFKTGCDPHSPFKRMNISYYDFSIKRDPLFTLCSTTTTEITPWPCRPSAAGKNRKELRQRKWWEKGVREGRKKITVSPFSSYFRKARSVSSGPCPSLSTVWAFEGFCPPFSLEDICQVSLWAFLVPNRRNDGARIFLSLFWVVRFITQIMFLSCSFLRKQIDKKGENWREVSFGETFLLGSG